MLSSPPKVAIITGANTGIGAATARQFASMGFGLALSSTDHEELMELARQCHRLGSDEQQLLLLAGDLSEDKNVNEIVTRTVDTFGRIDILVNNLSWDTIGTDKDVMQLYDDVIGRNIRAVFHMTQQTAPHLVTTQGCIINNYETPSLQTSADKVVYGIVKKTLDHFMESAAVDLAPKGVRINSVNPGAITSTESCTNKGEKKSIPTKTREDLSYNKPRSQDKDIAATICFLASDDAAMITGKLISVNGGKHVMPCTPIQGP